MRIKGFDKDLRCLGIQYEIGKEYKTSAEHITKDDLCSDKVFHYCDSLKNVHYFYPCQPYNKNRYCEIEVLGEEVTDGKKYGSNHIKIVREIIGKELLKMKEIGRNNGYFNIGKGNTGFFNKGTDNVGDNNDGLNNYGKENIGCFNNGSFNSGSVNAGYKNYGRDNEGDANYGANNLGYYNRGNRNKGYANIGNGNIGRGNVGEENNGFSNDGEYNIGEFNSGSNNIGVLCTDENKSKLYIFNKESNITLKQWHDHPAYKLIKFLKITEWVHDWDMTDEEKEENPSYEINGGYLKKYEYKEAWQNFWETLKNIEKETIKTIPNFDPHIFEEITGIKI